MAKPTEIEKQGYEDLRKMGRSLSNGESENIRLMAKTIGKLAELFSIIMEQGIVTVEECAAVHAGSPRQVKYIAFGSFRISGYALSDIFKAALGLSLAYLVAFQLGLLPEWAMLPQRNTVQSVAIDDPRTELIHDYLLNNNDKYAKMVRERLERQD